MGHAPSCTPTCKCVGPVCLTAQRRLTYWVPARYVWDARTLRSSQVEKDPTRARPSSACMLIDKLISGCTVAYE